jgi:alpha/beta superfamily hydrolase
VSTPIRANSILPGRREDIELHTADDLTLVGELARPADRDPIGTLVCFHPLPTHGGMMDSHILRKAAWRLPALAGLAVLRFNTRGTSSVRGTSQGTFDGGVGERYDVAAAIEYAEFHELPRIWLLGWSFGTDLVLRYGCDPAVAGAILLSPPLRSAGPDDLAVWAESGKPVTALVPEFDDYLRPAEARERFAALPQAEVIGVPGAKHLWVGHTEVVLDEIVKRVASGEVGGEWGRGSPGTPVPLPRAWDGPMEYGDASAYKDRTVAAFADIPIRESGRAE